MKLKELIRGSLKVFSRPHILILYVAFDLLSISLGDINTLLSILLFLFLQPLIKSYILTYFFIEAVDKGKLREHQRMAFRFYVTFLKISFIYLLIYFLSGITIYGLGKQPSIFQSLIFQSLIFTICELCFMFWLVSSVFVNKIGRAFKFSFRTPNTPAIIYLITFGVLLLINMIHIRFKIDVDSFKNTNVLFVLFFNIFSAICSLVIYKIITLIIASGGEVSEWQSRLNDYLSKKGIVLEAIHDEKIEVKQANKCLILGCLSFIPLVHLFAVYFGRKRFLSQEYGKFRAIFGFIIGAFFTLMYLMMLIGIIFSTNRFGLNRGRETILHTQTMDKYISNASAPKELKAIWQEIKQSGHYFDIAVLEKIETENPKAKYFALGIDYKNLSHFDKAIEMFKKCSELPQHNGEAFFHLGLIYLYGQDKIDEAARCFDKFLQFFPSDRETLGYIELIKNRIDRKNNIIVVIITVVVLLISMSSHEFAHAYTAYRCGDSTAKDMGRMTLNPLAHLDPFGSIILPGILIWSKSSVVFGWARPVMVKKENFKKPERDDVLVSLMGPSVNILIALIATVLFVSIGLLLALIFPELKALYYFLPAESISISGIPLSKFWIYVNIFLSELIVINIALGVFNLLPISPLDGSWIFPKMLPERFRSKYEIFNKYATILFIILLFTHIFDVIINIPLQVYFSFLDIFSLVLGLG